MPENRDLRRLRDEYEVRDSKPSLSDKYSLFNPSNLYILQQRLRSTLELLSSNNIKSLRDKRILEVGCGRGEVLFEYLWAGAEPAELHGTDLIQNRVRDAHTALPNSLLTCSDGQNLPYPQQTFDLVFQYTVFSSILDTQVRSNLAREMLRVLKPTGMLVWYDFWYNPTNPQTRGIRPEEIRSLFPGCRYKFKKITLAPPIARRVVPVSWGLAQFLEGLRFLNSHFLVSISPNSSQ